MRARLAVALAAVLFIAATVPGSATTADMFSFTGTPGNTADNPLLAGVNDGDADPTKSSNQPDIIRASFTAGVDGRAGQEIPDNAIREQSYTVTPGDGGVITAIQAANFTASIAADGRSGTLDETLDPNHPDLIDGGPTVSVTANYSTHGDKLMTLTGTVTFDDRSTLALVAAGAGGGPVQDAITVVQVEIVLNGANVAGKTNDEPVGRLMSLSGAALGGAAPVAGLHDAPPNWSIPGVYYRSWASTGGLPVGFTQGAASAIFYWVDAADGRVVQYTQIAYGDRFTASTAFNVKAPMPSILPHSGAVGCDAYHGDATIWLHDGLGHTDPLNADHASSGVYLDFGPRTVTVDGFQGHYTWAQIVTGSSNTGTVSPTDFWSASSDGLDPGGPGSYDSLWPDGTMTDSPGIPVQPFTPADPNVQVGLTSASKADTFSDWLLWQPDEPDATPVPMLTMGWKWSGASAAGVPWTITAARPAGLDPQPTLTTAYPTWDHDVNTQPVWTEHVQ